MLSQDQFYKTLRETIVDTFEVADLEMVVGELGKNLYAIVRSDSANRVVYHLLRVASREGWLESLLKALAAARPQNERFKTTIAQALATLAAQTAETGSDLDHEPEPGEAVASARLPKSGRTWDNKHALWSKVAYAVGGVIAALTLNLIVALAHFWLLARPLSVSIGAPVTALLLIASSLLGVWLGLRYEAWKRR